MEDDDDFEQICRPGALYMPLDGWDIDNGDEMEEEREERLLWQLCWYWPVWKLTGKPGSSDAENTGCIFYVWICSKALGV